MPDLYDETASSGRSTPNPNRHRADVYKDDARSIHDMTGRLGGSDPFSWAVCASVLPMVITDPRAYDNPIIFANEAFTELTGFQREETLGRNCRFLRGPSTSVRDFAYLEAAIGSRERSELELFIHRKDGTATWNRVILCPVTENGGESVYFLIWQFDVMPEQRRLAGYRCSPDVPDSENAGRDVEPDAIDRRLRSALSSGGFGSWTLNPYTNELRACAKSKLIYGCPPAEPFTYEQLVTSIHPEDEDRRSEIFRCAIDQGADIDIDFRILTPSGMERWVHVFARREATSAGTALLRGIVQDVTSRRRADEHRALIVDELSHRIKNTLTSLHAVVVQTMRHAGTIEEATATLCARIQAMAAANDLLVNERFESASIYDLLARALAPFGVEDANRFILEGLDIRLPPRLVMSFALSLHELATNATKYGALSNAQGMVRISWMVVTDTDTRRVHFVWTEENGPVVKRPTKTSFGTRLLQRVLEREIGGTAEILFLPRGLTFKAIAPLFDTGAATTAATPDHYDA